MNKIVSVREKSLSNVIKIDENSNRKITDITNEKNNSHGGMGNTEEEKNERKNAIVVSIRQVRNFDV